MPTVFISDAIHQERLVFNRSRVSADQPRRRWKTLAALYQASLVACGYRVEAVVRPEIYQTEWAHRVKHVTNGDWHLAVKPIEHIRPFHGIPNVFVCDWPFSQLSNSCLGGFPFFNQVTLLEKADAVICCTEFTTQTLRRAGIGRAITLPPCITPCSSFETAAAITRRERRPRQTFLTVADIDTPLQQLRDVIEGFLLAYARRSDLHLVVCLQGSAQALSGTLELKVSKVFAAQMNDAVSFVTPGIGQTSMARLLGAADFFLCASSAEGLSLPMIEAMFAGVPLVATMDAGPGSFLTREAVISIPARPVMATADSEPIAAHMPLMYNLPTIDGVCDASLVAAALDPVARSSMARMCREIARDHFSFAAFQSGLERLSPLIPMKHP